MRKLIYSINLSIDGCCDHTKLSGNEEIHEFFTDLIQQADLLLYGRKTYELMVPFWPEIARNRSGETKAMNDFAQTFDAVSKLVFSKTLKGTEDKRTRIVNSDLQEEVLKIKQENGGNILAGGVSLPSQLIELGLVDEFVFVVQPFLVGEGRRLDHIRLQENQALKLVGSRTFKNGSMALRYEKQ